MFSQFLTEVVPSIATGIFPIVGVTFLILIGLRIVGRI